MGLQRDLLHLDLDDRIQRDDAENRLYINFEKLRIRSREDIARIRARVEALCEGQSRPVDVIVNYDGARVDEDVEAAYVEMVSDLEARYYGAVTRYSSSAFTRMKLGTAFTRTVQPHIFETAEDARAFLAAHGPMRSVACIGECMVELSLPREPGGPARVGFAGDTANAAIYLKRSAPAVEVAYVTAVGTDALSERHGRLPRRARSRHRPDRAAGRPGAGALRDQPRRRGRAQLHLLARRVGGAHAVPRALRRSRPDRLAGFGLIYLSGITLAVLAPEARAAICGRFSRRTARGADRSSFDSNYRPRLWPDEATARREMAALWRLTDIALPSLDDEIALWGDGDLASTLARFAEFGVNAGALKRGAEGPIAIGWDGPLPASRWSSRSTPPRPATASTARSSRRTSAARRRPDCLSAGHAMASEVVQHPGAIMPLPAR